MQKLMLTGQEKKGLRARARSMEARVKLGKGGLSTAFLDELERVVQHDELVKVRFTDFKEEKKQMAQTMADHLGAELIQIVGNTAIIFRRRKSQ
jgi:RNA-binding protein